MRNSDGTTLVFIPTYNDFSHLQYLIDQLNAELEDATVLVVDDGSESPSPRITGCLYVKLPFNLGLGVATQIAMDVAHNRACQRMVRLDADGQHPVNQVQRLLDALANADLAIATRNNRHGASSLREILSTLARSYITLVSRLTLRRQLPKDLNSGFIALDRKAIELLRRHELDRFPEPQLMIICAANDLAFTTIEIDQNDRAMGTSSVTVSAAIKLLYRVTLYTVMTMTGAYRS